MIVTGEGGSLVRHLRLSRREVRYSIFAAVIGIVALAAPGAVRADDINTPAGHHAEDEVVHDAATEARLNSETRLRSAWASAATAAAVAADPGQVGQWGPVVDWPVVGIHVALLPNGKVLAWDSVGDAATETFPVQNFTRATVYDPITGTQTPTTVDTGYNIFCSGFAHLFDGSSVHRRRKQKCATRGDRPDASVLTPRPTTGASALTWPPGAGIRRSRR